MGMKEGDYVSGYVLIKDYSILPTKTGSKYVDGTLEAQGSIQFKVWSNSAAYMNMTNNDFKGKICIVGATVNIYGGVTSLILNSIEIADEEDVKDYSLDDFFECKYNTSEYLNALDSIMKSVLSEEAYKLFGLIMNVSEIKERFPKEYAAKGHHDNCVGGLLAHTYKVVFMTRFVKLYPNILKRLGNLDVLILGAFIHDIGKIREYSTGVISDMGKLVSHHTFGVLMLNDLKKYIVEVVGEGGYYRLLSIVEQHHGEYAEHPRTIEAYLVHLFDLLDSDIQSIDQKLEGDEDGVQLRVGEFKLS